jgi:uncharacterized protein YecT (DUF1311 family)
MRPIIVLLLATISLGAPIARADPFESYDPSLIAGCLVDGMREGTYVVCKGAGALNCIETDGPSTMSEALCWSHEAEQWGEYIDTSMTTLEARAPERQQALRAAQNAWVVWSDAECTYRSEPTAGGSGVQVEFARCAADLAADRAFILVGSAMNGAD